MPLRIETGVKTDSKRRRLDGILRGDHANLAVIGPNPARIGLCFDGGGKRPPQKGHEHCGGGSPYACMGRPAIRATAPAAGPRIYGLVFLWGENVPQREVRFTVWLTGTHTEIAARALYCPYFGI